MHCNVMQLVLLELSSTGHGEMVLILCIPCTKQLNVFMHLLRKEKCLYESLGTMAEFVDEVFRNGRTV